MRDDCARERAAREAATDRAIEMERQRNQLRVDLADERAAHEETRRANREAEQAFLDELLARRAAASRLAEAEECLRGLLRASGALTGNPASDNEAERIARAFLAGGKTK